MNSRTGIYTAMAFLLGASATTLRAGDPAPRIQELKPQNGVFVTSTGYMKTVLELKDGHFRYWFKSDAKMSDEPAYPLEGTYSTSGNTIKLGHEKVSQKEWTFRTVDGVVSLWRPDALKSEASFTSYAPIGAANFKHFGTGAILVATTRSAKQAWDTDEAMVIEQEKDPAPAK